MLSPLSRPIFPPPSYVTEPSVVAAAHWVSVNVSPLIGSPDLVAVPPRGHEPSACTAGPAAAAKADASEAAEPPWKPFVTAPTTSAISVTVSIAIVVRPAAAAAGAVPPAGVDVAVGAGVGVPLTGQPLSA